MKFMSILLKEGRKEDLLKKYGNKFSEEVLSTVMTEPFITHTNYKYADFLLKHLNPNFSQAEFEEVINALKKFDKVQHRLEKRDINQYTGFFDLVTTINEYIKTNEKPKSKKVYEDDKFIVVEPQNYVASCKYGAKTTWCTTMKNNDSYFKSYTSGNQSLYYVISKRDLEENLYKIAIHYDKNGQPELWDAADTKLPKNMVVLFKNAYPELWESVKKYHFETHPDMTRDVVRKELNNSKEYILGFEVSSIQKIIKIKFGGYEVVEIDGDNFMVASEIKIYGPSDDNGPYELLDEYMVHIVAKMQTAFNGKKGLEIDWSLGEIYPERKVDLGLDGFGNLFGLIIEDGDISGRMTKMIFNQLVRTLEGDKKLLSYYNAGPSWRPDRIGYGYTFGKNKGLIKKLVDWLGNSKVGTKLDFLVDIGKLDEKVENGKKYYSHKGKNDFSPSVNWRGHFASFFASAKMAGILDYRKIGNQFLLIKGPNYDAFVKGELKAL